MACDDAVEWWYNEIKNYNYHNHKSMNEEQVGHFTQIVWRATSKVGMAFSTRTLNGITKVFAVARYSPARNFVWNDDWIQSYGSNVMPSKVLL